MTQPVAPESPMAAMAGIFPPEFLDDPYSFYAQMREAAPVMFIEPMNAWLLTRYDDVKHAAGADEFRVNFEEYQINRMGPTVVDEKYFLSAKETMVCNDPPKHTQMRKVFARGFTARRVRELPSFIEAYAHTCLDEVKGNSMDVVPDFARRVPLGVLSHILGVPQADWHRMEKWVQDYSPVLEVFPMTQEQMHLANDATAGLEDYFRWMIKDRRENPTEDYISECLAENDSLEEPLTDEELISNFGLVYFAGHDTQEKQFGNFINTLDLHPEHRDWLVADTSRVDAAMPELLRFDTVGQFMGRCPREDLELGGQTLKAGQIVMVCYGAANRDPEMFPEPDKLDFHRTGQVAPHITFGSGRHRCIGAALALQNMPIMLRVLLERCPGIQVDRDNMRRHMSLATRGFDSLPISWNA